MSSVEAEFPYESAVVIILMTNVIIVQVGASACCCFMFGVVIHIFIGDVDSVASTSSLNFVGIMLPCEGAVAIIIVTDPFCEFARLRTTAVVVFAEGVLLS